MPTVKDKRLRQTMFPSGKMNEFRLEVERVTGETCENPKDFGEVLVFINYHIDEYNALQELENYDPRCTQEVEEKGINIEWDYNSSEGYIFGPERD